MSSILKVDTIQDQNGNNIINENANTITIGASGDTITIPSGATLDASNATLTLPDDSVTTAKLAYDPNAFRNIVINGDMQVAQRGTSSAGLGTGTNNVYLIDRFKFIFAGAPTGRFTMSQSTDVPTGQGFANSLKLDCTTAQVSPASGDAFYLATEFEGQNLQYLKKGTANALPLTASFWVKSTKTGNYVIDLYDGNNTRIIGNTYTVNSSNTWEFKTITFPGDTTGALTNDNGSSLRIWFVLTAGSSFTGTDNTSWGAYSTGKFGYNQTVNIADNTANDFLITGVQLEAGSQASEFEFMPIDVNLARCQRYCWKVSGASDETLLNLGAGVNTTAAQFFGAYPVRMRATPTLSGSSLNISILTGSTLAVTAVTILNSTPQSFRFQLDVASGATAGTPYFPRSSGSGGNIQFSAEL